MSVLSAANWGNMLTRTKRTTVKDTRLARKMFPTWQKNGPETLEITEKILVSNYVRDIIYRLEANNDTVLLAGYNAYQEMIYIGIPEKHIDLCTSAMTDDIFLYEDGMVKNV